MTEGLDSPLASVATVASPDDARPIGMSTVPPLAWLAASASLADLALNRILLKLGHEMWSVEALGRLDRWGGFARNLSVVAALVALVFCLGAFSSRRSQLPLSARAGIATFGWVLIPIVTLMTLLPLSWTRAELVLVVAGLSHAVVLLLVLAGLHWRSSPALVSVLILTLVASVSGIASTMVSLVGRRSFWEHADRLSNAFRWSGELAYLAAPLALGFALAIPWRTPRGRLALVTSTAGAALVAIGMAFWQRAVHEDLPTMVYGAFRLDLLPDQLVLFYAIPLGIASAVLIAAGLSKDPTRQQMSAALLLLTSAGYAPRTPSALIITVVGVALLSRSAIAVARRRRTV